MTDKLPIKLKNETLFDVIFEMRFTSKVPASDVFPGFLFSKLDGDKEIERLPAAEIPRQIRVSDPNFAFSPLVRIKWNNYVISVGEHSLILGCKMPYPGWNNFKEAILSVVKLIQEPKVVDTVQRFSMKYINLIPEPELHKQILSIDTSVKIGGHKLEKENFSLRIEIPNGEIINIVNVVSSATVKNSAGIQKEGIVVDVDTITKNFSQPVDDWVKNLSTNLDELHLKNKTMFFEIITKETRDSLGPIYE